MFTKLAALVAILATGVIATPLETRQDSGSASDIIPPGPRLTCGFHWVDDVSGGYLQNQTPYLPSGATMGDVSTAGQFIIVSGGLIQLTSQIPNLQYNYAAVDETTGEVSFANGDVPPSPHGTFAFAQDTQQELTYTTLAGVTSNSFMLCGSQLMVELPGVEYEAACAPTTLLNNKPPCAPPPTK